MDRRPPLAVPPEILIRKTPDKAVLAMLVILARTDIVAGRANHNAWNALLLLAKTSGLSKLSGDGKNCFSQGAKSRFFGLRPQNDKIRISRAARYPGWIATALIHGR